MTKLAVRSSIHSYFFFNDTATTEIYTLSLHDALPIYVILSRIPVQQRLEGSETGHEQSYAFTPAEILEPNDEFGRDRKSTRLNSSHANISYAVFCLKKTNKSSRSARNTSYPSRFLTFL